MNNNFQNQFDAMDLLNVLSFYISILNLKQNQEQSTHDEIEAANQRQEEHIIKRIEKMFEEQNEMLMEVLRRIKILEERI